jgi:hypothetical protein
MIGKRFYLTNNIWMKLVKTFSDVVAAPVLRAYYNFRYLHIAPVNRSIWINPEKITGWYRGDKYDEITFEGQIKGGDWSSIITLKNEMLGKSLKYSILVDRFVNQKPWSEIDDFKELYKRIVSNKALRNQKIKTLGEFEDYYEKTYGKMFNEIKSKGFLPSNKKNPGITPIYVCIGPEGQLYMTVDGNHRLFMAMILKEKTIPVKVLKRHKIWQKTKDLILSKHKTNLPIYLEKYKLHPDIIGYSIDHDDEIA